MHWLYALRSCNNSSSGWTILQTKQATQEKNLLGRVSLCSGLWNNYSWNNKYIQGFGYIGARKECLEDCLYWRHHCLGCIAAVLEAITWILVWMRKKAPVQVEEGCVAQDVTSSPTATVAIA